MTSENENSTGYYNYMQGRLSLSRIDHAQSNSYVLIAHNLTGEFMRKFMQRLETYLLTEFCVIL